MLRSSEGYKSVSGAKNGIVAVILRSDSKGAYKLTTGNNSFTLTAANGEAIGVSEEYASRSAAERGIDAVKEAVRSLLTAGVNKLKARVEGTSRRRAAN